MKTVVVISKYNEDITWAKDIIHDVIIYDKSENPLSNSIVRPNIGREAETLLYYIIENYNNLPDLTIFLQGDPRSNPILYTYDEVIKEVNKNHEYKLKTILTYDITVNVKDYWLKSCNILNLKLFGKNYNNIKYSSGAQYVIPKNVILNRPLELYILLHQNIIKYGNLSLIPNKKTLKDGIDAWTLELIWGNIFNINVKLLDNYKKNIINEN